ncbi:acyloxyacyl hydrolase [Granulicella sp. dw_53]|uniref:acyloxyacyl hydrolase n=1 Tax=Granulicella sp. dw_53 TaxID=2719792 RepID=UPI001BD509D5|nr:acyloxyacyl hydrolase [Granulicella sp. dw_53]
MKYQRACPTCLQHSLDLRGRCQSAQPAHQSCSRHRFQPFFIANGGFLASPRDLPVNNSSRFNFTFEFGGGLEPFRDHRHAWSIDYRIHHLSNAYLGRTNPGINSQLITLTHSFGR